MESTGEWSCRWWKKGASIKLTAMVVRGNFSPPPSSSSMLLPAARAVFHADNWAFSQLICKTPHRFKTLLAQLAARKGQRKLRWMSLSARKIEEWDFQSINHVTAETKDDCILSLHTLKHSLNFEIRWTDGRKAWFVLGVHLWGRAQGHLYTKQRRLTPFLCKQNNCELRQGRRSEVDIIHPPSNQGNVTLTCTIYLSRRTMDHLPSG